MAYANGKITAPVSIYDIQQALSTSQNDLGSLCRNASINMWAKYKPVTRQNLIDTTGQLNNPTTNKTWKTSAAIEAGGHQGESWWKGDDTNHGLTVPFVTATWSPAGFVTALNSVAAMINGAKNGWTYTPPAGGMAAPFRQIDFLQYNKNAPNPVRTSRGTDTVYAAVQQAWTYSFDLMEVEPEAYDSRDYIVPTDLRIDGTIWQTLYVGLAIFKNTGTAQSPVYSAMAWCIGNSWNGSGVIYSDQQDGVDTTTSGTNAIAKFKDGATYYALPLYFTKSDLAQQNVGQSYIGASSGCKIIPIPYTNFMSFNAVRTDSAQHIVFPSITNNKVTKLGAYTGSVKLSSAVDGYNGSQTSFRVDAYFALQSWDDDDAHITQDNVIFHQYKTYSSFANNTEDTPSELSMALTNIGLTKQWKIVVKVAGEAKDFALIQPTPLTPTNNQ